MTNVISGYFQAAYFGVDAHPGYVDYLNSASDCDILIIIVQSVSQQYKKYGPLAKPLHSIIQNLVEWCKLHLKCKVAVMVNHNNNIAESLRYVATRYDEVQFCKDGDRDYESLPQEEKDVLNECKNIKFKFLGNAKKASSSEIIAKNNLST